MKIKWPGQAWLKIILAALMVAGGLLNSQADESKVLRIGYQKSGAFLLARFDGGIEKALAPLGYRVEWKEFLSGPALIEALNAGSVDVGHCGDCPIILAQAAGVPLLYIGSSQGNPHSAAIIVPVGSSLHDIADLKGKKVAFTRGSSGHYLLARALESKGLTLADIQPAYLSPPDARAAFQSGAVDAWSIWDPFFAAAEVDSGARILVSSQGLSSHREFYFGQRDYLQQNPAVVGPILAALNKADQRISGDPAGTAAFLSDKLGIKPEILLRALARNTRYNVGPLTPEVVAEQQQVADFLFQQGIVPKPVRVADAVFHSDAVVLGKGAL